MNNHSELFLNNHFELLENLLAEPINFKALFQNYSFLRDMAKTPQDPIWHGEGNVWIHTQMVIEKMHELPEFRAENPLNQAILLLSALFHDVEKRSTTQEEWRDGQIRIISPKHAKKGEFTTRAFFYRDLPIPFSIREQICSLVRWHGLPLWILERENPERLLIKISQKVSLKLLAILAKADVLGRICPDQNELLDKIELFIELAKENQCWESAFLFENDLARYHYLNHENSLPNYVPFDDFTFEVHLLSGLPATGKDYFIKKRFNDLPVISLDDIRRTHGLDPSKKEDNGQAIQLGKEACKVLLRQKQSFVFNATNITVELRGKWLDLFHSYGAKTNLYYLETPYQILLKQNKNRAYPVPEQVIEKLLLKLEIPQFNEAHSVYYEVN